MGNIIQAPPGDATRFVRGVVNIGAQEFSGNKSFYGEVIARAGIRFLDGTLQTTANVTALSAVPSGVLLGRYSLGSGSSQTITVGTGLDLSAGGVLSATGGTGPASSLNDAYIVGNIIALTNARPFNITLPGVGTAAISLNANAASNFTVTSANLTLATLTSGSVEVTGVDGVNVRSVTTFGTAVTGSQAGRPVGYRLRGSGTSAFSAGHVVRYASTSILAKSDATGAGVAREVAGIAIDGDTSTTPRVATLYGVIAEVLFDVAPVAGDSGKVAYLSTATPGTASLAVPTSNGHRVFRLGTLIDHAVGPNGGYYIVYQPAFVADL